MLVQNGGQKPMSFFHTAAPFKPGQMNGSFPSICVTSLSGQHVRFGHVDQLG